MMDWLLDQQAVELLYQAVLEPDCWSKMLATILPGFRSKHASFFTAPVANGIASSFFQHGFSDAELKIQYSPEAMRFLDNWRAQLPVGKIFTNRHFASDRDWERSEAYNEYVRHSGVYHGAMFQQFRPDFAFYFAICRPNRDDPYSDEELAGLQPLTAHLGNALHLQLKLNRSSQQHTNLMSAAFDKLSEAALIVNARGMPLFINARAQELLDRNDGLINGPSGLKTHQSTSTQNLLDAIRAAGDRRWMGSLYFSVPRRKVRLPLLLEVLPLSRLNLDTGGAGEAAVLICIKEPDAPFRANRQALADTLRLTSREIDLASLLAEGVSANSAASRMGISIGTARFHIKRIFQKTGVHSQGALVSLIRGFGTR